MQAPKAAAIRAAQVAQADGSIERRERRELRREMDRANDRFYGAPQREREQEWRRQMPGGPAYDYQPPRRDGR